MMLEVVLEVGFWSKEVVWTMLTELLIPLLVLVGSSLLFILFGKKCVAFVRRICKLLLPLSSLEVKLGLFNELMSKLGLKLSELVLKVQTGKSNPNILFLMLGLAMLCLGLML
jgi:hypothetical protein